MTSETNNQIPRTKDQKRPVFKFLPFGKTEDGLKTKSYDKNNNIHCNHTLRVFSNYNAIK